MTDQLTGIAPEGEQTGGDSTLTVLVAFAANAAIAVAKTVVAMLTGSASMLAESAHSWADTGNEVLLLIADRRGKRAADDSHPFGYGREAYVWSMFAALGLFTAGAVVSVWNGVSKLFETGGETSYLWAYVVLGISAVLEGASFAQAFRQTHREAQQLDRGVLQHALETSDPTLRAVFAEDSAAVTGLAIAALGIFLHQLTGNAVYDAVGSILVGLLLGGVAIILIQRNLRFLSGQESDADLRDTAISVVRDLPEVARVSYMRLEFVGPRQLLLVAAVDLEGDHPESSVATTLRRLEHHLEQERVVADAVLTLAAPDEPSI